VFSIRTRDFAQLVRIGLPEMQRRRDLWRQRWARLFGTGVESEVLYGDPWAMAYRIGPHSELLGRRVAAVRVRTSPLRAGLENAGLFRDVSRSAKYFPTLVTGPLQGVPFGEHRDVAVAVNGRIRAVGGASTCGSRAASSTRCSFPSQRCAAGATGSRCSRSCRPARSRAFSACRPSSARRSGPRRSSPGPCLRR
jgi:hypothetical protein